MVSDIVQHGNIASLSFIEIIAPSNACIEQTGIPTVNIFICYDCYLTVEPRKEGLRLWLKLLYHCLHILISLYNRLFRPIGAAMISMSFAHYNDHEDTYVIVPPRRPHFSSAN